MDSSSYAEQDEQVPTTTTGSVPQIGALNDGILKLGQDTSYVGGYDADGDVVSYLSENPGSDDPQNWTLGGSSIYTTTFIKQNGMLAASTTVTPNVSSGSSPATDTSTYNDLGELVSVSGTDYGSPFQRNYAYDADGQILERQITEGSSTQTVYYAYANGNELGGVDSSGNIDITPTSAGFSNSDLGSSNYQVQIGDTLASVAQTIYGNSNYGYIIAEANGLSGDSQLVAGMNLEIPQVTTNSNTSDTFKPYNAKSIIGSTDPTATPPPPAPPPAASSSGCGPVGEIIMVAVIIVASIYTAGLAAGAFGATATATGATSTFALGSAAVTGGGLVGAGGVALGAGIGIGSAAIGGFVGSVAGQGVGDAEGITHGFSLGQALTAGLSAGIGAGIGSALSAAGNNGATLLERSTQLESSQLGAASAYGASETSMQLQPLGAALSSAGNYVANVVASDITGQPSHFSWAELVASSVAAGITNAAGLNKNGPLQEIGINAGGFQQAVAGGLLGGGIDRETSKFLGDDRVSSWKDIGENAVGNALGGYAVSQLDPDTNLYSASLAQGGDPDALVAALQSSNDSGNNAGSLFNSTQFQSGESMMPDGRIVSDSGPERYGYDPNDTFQDAPGGPVYSLIGTSEDGMSWDANPQIVGRTVSGDGRTGYAYSDGFQTLAYRSDQLLPEPYLPMDQGVHQADQGLWGDLQGNYHAWQNGYLSLGGALGMSWQNLKYRYETSNQAQGATKVFGGGLEMVGAAGITAGTDGAAAPIGVVLAAHAADKIKAGFTQMFYDEDTQTDTYRAVLQLTGSPKASAAVDNGMSFLSNVGAAGLEAPELPTTTFQLDAGGSTADIPPLWTDKSIFNAYPEKVTLQFSGPAEQAAFLSEHIPELGEDQAQLILDKSFTRNSSAVFGGSRIRGDFTSGGFGVGSDIDVGFGDLNANQAGKLIDSLNKQFSQDASMLMLERTRITPGNSTPTITDPIISPEEFFQRSGMRVAPDLKAGQPYVPSGSVTVRPDGTITITPPGSFL